MPKEILLKNTLDVAIIDADVYDFLFKDAFYTEINFLQNLRMHSHGYAFYQKSIRKSKGNYSIKTLYLHKIIAENFIEKPKGLKQQMVLYKNGNKLDCRKENLFWADRSTLQRIHQKANGKSGYKGVYKEGKHYKAIAYINKEPFFLGKYNTAEEAAKAYNSKIESVFSEIPAFLNKI